MQDDSCQQQTETAGFLLQAVKVEPGLEGPIEKVHDGSDKDLERRTMPPLMD